MNAESSCGTSGQNSLSSSWYLIVPAGSPADSARKNSRNEPQRKCGLAAIRLGAKAAFPSVLTKQPLLSECQTQHRYPEALLAEWIIASKDTFGRETHHLKGRAVFLPGSDD